MKANLSVVSINKPEVYDKETMTVSFDVVEYIENNQTKYKYKELCFEEEINNPLSVLEKWKIDNYALLRTLEYPPIADYLDGIAKADIEQVQNYIDKCLAVKAKYPKEQ